jgi:HSP20 family molecular chaperone IbpA
VSKIIIFYDHLGKIYREFKREIHLESDVDLNAIKNVLHEGILTLKIPKENRPDGMGSVSNSHNLQSPNGFSEIYTDDGKLIKLTSDFRGYNPENVKIVLSANNVLKVTASQSEQSPNSKGTVQKECTRHYTLPAWVQPENMKAIMSRDGTLNVDIRH